MILTQFYDVEVNNFCVMYDSITVILLMLL